MKYSAESTLLHDEEETSKHLVARFDSICRDYGEHDAVALLDGSACSYAELEYASLNVARQLHNRYRPDVVLVDCRNSAPAAELVAVVACMRIGVPFCPVDTSNQHTGKSLQTVVRALQPSKEACVRISAIVLAENDRDPFLASFGVAGIHNCVLVSQTGDLLEPMQVPEYLPKLRSDKDNLYILFTSGTSSNSPKAVIGSHDSTARRLDWFQKQFPANVDTVVARRTRLTFVDGVTELLSGTMAPVTLYTIDATLGMATLRNSPCTRATMLPSQLSQWLSVVGLEDDDSSSALDYIIISGEPCPVSLLNEYKRCRHFRTTVLLNLYGQTETTGDFCAAALTGVGADPVVKNVVPVGRPFPGVILDTSDSTHGELVVSGSCLSNGYYNNLQDETNESFHTGDIGFCVDGCWYVQGRVDEMCKINGIVTRPSEVESCLQQVFPDKATNSVCVMLDSDVSVMVESDSVAFFSRERMSEAGIPWNLIPKLVFAIHRIPVKTGGAGKVNRTRVKELICERLLDEKSNYPVGSCEVDELVTVLSTVLNIPVSRILQEKGSSFVELGGDSALAVTLLYRLKADGLLSTGAPTTAKDLLYAGNLQDLRAVVQGTPRAKKQKLDNHTPDAPMFRPFPVTQVAESEDVILFAACVDAAPLVYSSFVYGACQGGVVQRVDMMNGTIQKPVSFHLGARWKVQADMILLEDEETLLVCGYDPERESAAVFALSLDLKILKWMRELADGMIKSTPVCHRSVIHVLSGKRLFKLGATNGEILNFNTDSGKDRFIELPASSESRSILVATCQGDEYRIVYGLSDWDSGLQHILCGPKSTRSVNIPEITCPVYADLVAVDCTTFLAADIVGTLHKIAITGEAEPRVESVQVTSSPILSRLVYLGGDRIVFGCHDGSVYCVHLSNLSKIIWRYYAGAVVYSRVCPLQTNNEIAVCTTAGDVIVLRQDGTERWRFRVNAEIWSDPLVYTTDDTKKCRLVFGARDSKLHIVDLP